MESSFISQLIAQGVEHFCIAPGSRSTPLVLSAIANQGTIHVHYDERGLGFFALGIAKATRKPVALIVTSGTAVGNLLPSVMEAHHANIPLILLTADRPPELRDCGANQTTDQVKIFQPFIRWQSELSEIGASSLAAQSYFEAMKNPPGPVHINCPFREPFSLSPIPTSARPLHLSFPKLIADPFYLPYSKGLIVAGPVDDIAPILDLGARLHWPIAADILSNARLTPTDEQISPQPLEPEVVLHFGGRTTHDWLKNISAPIYHISPYPQLQDPDRRLAGRIQSDIGDFCKKFQAPSGPNWRWEKKNWAFSDFIPEDYGIFLGNSTTIRDADRYLFPRKAKGFFANRGLSGIDGNIATIAGLAQTMPIFALIGDQTALHDLNSLPLIKKTKYPVILAIYNNFGGGIFDRLPIAASPYHNTYWRASHSYRFEQIAHQFDIPYFQNTIPSQTAIVEWNQPFFSMAF